MVEIRGGMMNTRVEVPTKPNFSSKYNCLLSSTTFHFIEIEGRSYGGAKRRVAAVMFRVVDWIDPAVSRRV